MPAGAFVDRDRELDLLREQLEAVRSGQPRVVIVKGPPGIGKTALVKRFLDDETDVRVLRASGDEAESTLAYGVLDQLMATAGGEWPGGVGRLIDRPGPVADPVALGAAVIELVATLERHGPIAVVLDDAQWADHPSLQALVFALRRLRTDRVLAVIIVRDQEIVVLPQGLQRLLAERGVPVSVAGLDPADVRVLARELGWGELSIASAARLREHTGGNPLHLHALLEELSPEALSDPDSPLPAPRSFALLVAARLRECAPETQRLVVAASVLGVSCELAFASELAGIEAPLAALEQAISAGLLEERGLGAERKIAFAHPLIRAAVYHDCGPAQRAALHARAADGAHDHGSRLRHRVRAAAGNDERLAHELGTYAHVQAAKGSWASAASFFLDASRLTSTSARRQRYLVEGLESLISGGSFSEALGLAEDLQGLNDSVHRSYMLGRLALISGRHREAEKLLSRAWEQGDPHEPDVASRIACQLATLHLNQGRGHDAARWAERGLEHARAGVPGVTPTALWLLALGTVGREQEGLDAVGRLPQTVSDPEPADLDALIGRGILRLWSDDLLGARSDLTAVYEACRRCGPFHVGVIALFYLADAEYRLGYWADAVVHSELAASMAEDADQMWMLALTHAVAAFPLAGRGDFQAAEDHARLADGAAQALGDMASVTWAAVARARLAQARGDHDDVVGALQRLPRLEADVSGLQEPGIQPWAELYAEALVHLGRFDEAEGIIAALEQRAAERDLRSAVAAVARVRGVLEVARGHGDEAERAFEHALGQAQTAGVPFTEGLVEMSFGAALRRQGKRRAAARRLTAARDIFSRLGARPFLGRCDQELSACGLAPAKRSRPGGGGLTPQELAVARLVTCGLTNAEVARKLVVSTKTIEFHLSNVYSKLGISTRRQLAERL